VCDGKDSRRLPSACRVVTGCNARVRAQVNHLVELGVNAVELLPVFEYDELEFQRSRNPRDHMVNVWGYSHLSFFAPMARFASDGAGPAAAAREFKELVRALRCQSAPAAAPVLSLPECIHGVCDCLKRLFSIHAIPL